MKYCILNAVLAAPAISPNFHVQYFIGAKFDIFCDILMLDFFKKRKYGPKLCCNHLYLKAKYFLLAYRSRKVLRHRLVSPQKNSILLAC